MALCATPPVAAPSAVAPDATLASLDVLPGAAIDPHLFGYDFAEESKVLAIHFQRHSGPGDDEALDPSVLF
eukprot:COSAG02_NODE_2153_length_9654_cov_6.361905_1_plen_71_part_00